jgi:hypothetical protein
MLAESADACAMVTFRSAASASTRQRASLRKPAGLGPVASTRSRIATGPGTAPRLTSSNAYAGFEAAWCWLLQVRSIGASAPAAFGNMSFWDWLRDADSIPGWIRAASAALRSTSPAPASHIYAAHTDIRAPMLDATERATHASCAVEKIIGLARSASPTLRGLLERVSSGVGQARGHSIRIRGKRADVWSPHTVLGRGVPCRGIVASSRGLGCE